MERGFSSRLFGVYLEEIRAASAGLYQRRTKTIDDEINEWKGHWTNAYDRLFEIRRTDLLEYGMLLGRLAETYSSHLIAEDIFNRLAESAIRREPWIPDPSSVLITAGEFNRRRGNLDDAEARYNDALESLE